jgi:hypothetical protein
MLETRSAQAAQIAADVLAACSVRGERRFANRGFHSNFDGTS